MKKILTRAAGMASLFLMSCRFAWADGGNEDKASSEFNDLATFIAKVMTGPASKILALIFLVVAIWKIIHKDYGAAAGCVLALLALVFMPHFLEIF